VQATFESLLEQLPDELFPPTLLALRLLT